MCHNRIQVRNSDGELESTHVLLHAIYGDEIDCNNFVKLYHAYQSADENGEGMSYDSLKKLHDIKAEILETLKETRS
jgi:hypothetical protein